MRRPGLAHGAVALAAGAALLLPVWRGGLPIAGLPVSWGGSLAQAGVEATTVVEAARSQRPDTLRFRHENHAALECTECHATGEATSASRQQWCADCHHVSARPGECGRCHGAARLAGGTIPVLHAFRLSVGEPKSRRLTFEHSTHSELACAECHTGGDPTRLGRSCGSCHEPHHRPEADCMECHAEPQAGAHSEAVHRLGCGGAGCHVFTALEQVEAGGTRNACLVCHQAQRDHEPGGLCGKCHLLGGRRSAAPTRQGSR